VSTARTLLRTVAPEFAAVADATVDEFLVLSGQAHTSSRWGSVYTQALVWHAAHTMKTLGLGAGDSASTSTGSSGPVTSRSAGDLSVSYGSISASGPGADSVEADLVTTAYGRRYLDLLKRRAAVRSYVVTP
jgi:hypothetical protein